MENKRCQEKIYTEVNILGVVHKMALYMDTVILFLSRAMTSVPALISTRDALSRFSFSKINYDKSEAFLWEQCTFTSFPCNWVDSEFTYLGIKFSANLNNLYKLNLALWAYGFGTIGIIKHNLLRKSDLPLSRLVRVSLIKINVLPRILCPMQMLL